MSVIVPFAGDQGEAEAALARLARLRLGPGDELIFVDNGPGGFPAPADGPVRVIRATGERSSYHARNRGAERAQNDWLLFIDADCEPEERLLDLYFAEPIDPAIGVIGGRIGTADGAATLAARWARARGNVDQRRNLERSKGAVATGNMLVRREAWLAAGGFLEGIRSGGDLDICWRVQRLGWTVEHREAPAVEHPPKATVGGLARQIWRWAAGNAWQERRHPGSSPPPPVLRPVAAALVHAAAAAARGRRDAAGNAWVDAVVSLVRAAGRLGGNAAPRAGAAPAGRSVAVYAETFPARSETFIASEARALAGQGWRVRIEAAKRPDLPVLGGAREWRTDYLEDQGPAARARDLAWAVATRPLRCAVDLAWRRRFPRSERMPLRGLAPLVRRLVSAADDHVHVHFAGPAAAHGLRAARLAGLPASVVAHAYEIYAEPTALRAKLRAADLVVATCEYTRRDLAAMLPAAEAGKVERIVMGVDAERFKRASPAPDERVVAAVGRCVEKKGFRHLIEAAAILRERGRPVRCVIAGDGPLRPALERLATDLGVDGDVSFREARGFEAVRELLEGADLLAMPSVIAADGDRDSMPVVVKEAMAMELPVVGSDEVGIPEMIEPTWGRLVPPGDPEALAGAISELLALSADERAAMGAAGRSFVLAECNVDTEAARLSGLIERLG